MAVSVSVIVGMGAASFVLVGMAVVVSVMMMVAKGRHSNEVYQQAENAYNKQLTKSLRPGAVPYPLDGLEGNFNAEKTTR